MSPRCILMFSGKRKSGKDFITEKLCERLGGKTALIVRLSAPIKQHWAELHNLDLSELLSANSYKEQHRLAMIKWSEDERSKDYGVFCKKASDAANESNKPVWIVSDARRRTDLQWFRENFGSAVKTVRVLADEEVRIQRGWTFTEGVDDVASECDLDGVTDWDWILTNNKDFDEESLHDLEGWIHANI